MKTATMDIGSNSLRMMLSEYKDGKWWHAPKDLWSIRLGERTQEGMLSEASMRRTEQSLKIAKKIASDQGVAHFSAIATSAMREAPNGSKFAQYLEETIGVPIHIISGEEEATLGFQGAMGDLLKGSRMGASIDLGGASTEVAIGTKDTIQWKYSYPVGAVSMQHLSDEGPQRVWEETQAMWKPMPLLANSAFSGFVGMGGTITTLAAVDQELEVYDVHKVHGYILHREAVEAIALFLRYLSTEERKKVPGLLPNRADIIVAGADILTSFMDAYEIGSLVVSEKDILEGWHAKWSQNL